MNMCNCSLGEHFLHCFQSPFTLYLVLLQVYLSLFFIYFLILLPSFFISFLPQFLPFASDQIHFVPRFLFLPSVLSFHLPESQSIFFPFLTHSVLLTYGFIFTINFQSILFVYTLYFMVFLFDFTACRLFPCFYS